MRYAGLFFAVFVFAAVSNAQTLGVSTVTSDTTEIITGKFPAPPDRHFLIFEARLPATSAAECFAATDFSSAAPADPSRVSLSYDPATLSWYLKNSNAAGSPEGCTVLIVGSTVDARDYVMWRARFGSTSGFTETEGPLKEESEAASAQRSRVTSIQVTFSSQVTF